MRTRAHNTNRATSLAWLIAAAVVIAGIVGRTFADDRDDKRAEAEQRMRKAQEAQAAFNAAQKLAEAEARRHQVGMLRRFIQPQSMAGEIEGAEIDHPENDDCVVDDTPHGAAPVGGRQTGVAAVYFEQLVFGGSGTNVAAGHVQRLTELLRTKIGALHVACGLSQDQIRKLELAGQGDIARLLTRIEHRKQQYLPIRDENADAAASDILQDSMTFQRLIRDPFGDNSLFAKATKHKLTAEQYADLDVSRAIERMGGKILLRSHGSSEITTLRMNSAALADYRRAPWNERGNFRGLSLESTGATDKDLAGLNKLDKLELLDLGATRVTDDGLSHLKNMQNLMILDLRRTRVTNAGLAHLSQLTTLKYLHLGCSSATGAGLVHLRNLKNLESLFIFLVPITDDDLVHLAGLEKLKELALDGTPITDAGLAHLSGLTRLDSLGLSNTKLTDAGMKHLQLLTNLKSVNLFGTKVSDEAVADLKRFLPELKVTR